jgi:hypothetical protein
MKIRLAFLFVTLLAMVSALFAFMCYYQLSNYYAKLRSVETLLNEINNKNVGLHEEDLIILRLIEEQNKLIKAQDDKIRIQDALIAESRARTRINKR